VATNRCRTGTCRSETSQGRCPTPTTAVHRQLGLPDASTMGSRIDNKSSPSPRSSPRKARARPPPRSPRTPHRVSCGAGSWGSAECLKLRAKCDPARRTDRVFQRNVWTPTKSVLVGRNGCVGTTATPCRVAPHLIHRTLRAVNFDGHAVRTLSRDGRMNPSHIPAAVVLRFGVWHSQIRTNMRAR